MNLHQDKEDFEALCSLTARWRGIPLAAIKRDYFIVATLKRLVESEFADCVVFKGGTSLSKCYPGSIERFSEDIDLTYLGMDRDDKTCSKKIKAIIRAMSVDAKEVSKIPGEGNARNHSRLLSFGEDIEKIKLEIGCTVLPDPYGKKSCKTYVQEYLECIGKTDEVQRFGLREVTLNVLALERTFLDKVMAVKRHAICHRLPNKVRHIYDVVRLAKMDEIKLFLADKGELRRILRKVKETDSFYLKKRSISESYDSRGAYSFPSWRAEFESEAVRRNYAAMSADLIYGGKETKFEEALETFLYLDALFSELGE